ncbi:GAMM1 protein [Gautieria morchelliformis]|nr:GAMM1 protein [Gautieria morchelliformis]
MSSIAGALDEPAPKRVKTRESDKLIGTHNGTFHCDEALAVFLLRLTEAYKDADLIRTREPPQLARCDIVVDVGGVYDVAAQRFDHHQRGFEEVFGQGKYINIKLSSAGLVYKHFGKEIIAQRLGLPVSHQNVETLYLKLYGTFVEPIDAIDNGISQYDTSLNIEPRYNNRTDLSSRVGWLNPEWNESVDAKSMDERFVQASNLAGEEFLNRLDHYGKSWLPARDMIVAALNARKQVDPSGKIVLFDQFAPWKAHLFDLEEEHLLAEEEKPVYILYPDETANTWRVQAVPAKPESFESRKALPEAWRGLRDDELSEKSGISGGIFVHASGFIGGNKTRDGALQLAKAALTM